MVRTLLERGARIDFMDFEGRTGAQYAIAAGKHEVLDLLLSNLPNSPAWSAAGRDLFTAALQSADMLTFQTILSVSPRPEWDGGHPPRPRGRAQADMREQIRLS